MQLLFLLLLLLAVDLYTFQAVLLVSEHWLPLWRTLVQAVYWILPLALLLWTLTGEENWRSARGKSAYRFARAFLFILYFSKLAVISVLLIDDLRRGILLAVESFSESAYPMDRSPVLVQLSLLVGALPLTVLSYGMLRNPYRYRLHQHRITIPGLPEELRGFTIVQISDIHAGSFTRKEPLAHAIELINRQEADVVCFTGDLVNNRADEIQPYLDVFGGIRARLGVFSVFGNHDYGDYVPWPDRSAKIANLQRLADYHAAMGWTLLLNENRMLEVAGRRVAVIGVENYSALPRFQSYGRLEEAWQSTGDADLKILLSHDPTHWDAQVRPDFPDIDLTLSGHTHGMQFGIEIGKRWQWSPAQYVYKQWAGLYRKGNQWLNVNRGFGFLGYPGRVGILAEITRIEFG